MNPWSGKTRHGNFKWWIFAGSVCLWGMGFLASSADQGSFSELWSFDYAGQEIPEFLTGDECLFCHRVKVGPYWNANPHQNTLSRIVDRATLKRDLSDPDLADLADLAEFVMGSGDRIRYLKRSGDYGKLELLNPARSEESKDHFSKACAGCHTTAVDSSRRTFAALSIDCYSCHGALNVSHSKDTREALFSKASDMDPSAIVSVCGSCHVRFGQSRSSGLPYPNNFVPGNNLFLDFEVDLSLENLKDIQVSDRHILENIRDILVDGKRDVTCLNCHRIHRNSSRRHRKLKKQSSCWTCHEMEDVKKLTPDWTKKHSAVCEY